MLSTSSNFDWILADVKDGIGRITLNRPQALNALSLSMVRFLNDTLTRWQVDEAVQEVRIRGSNKLGPFGAFCAGGDIRFFHQAASQGNPELEDFFTEEYSLNYLIANYKKPYIAFMDGIVMGGGMGISQGASLRIVTEKSVLAMPETGIGLFPDVGGGYFLSRCPGYMGEFLALTGMPIKAGDAIAFGLADFYQDSHLLPEIFDSPELISEMKTFDSNNQNKQSELQTILQSKMVEIDQCFSANSLSELMQRLYLLQTSWSKEIIGLLEKRSPIMLGVSFEQIKRARQMTLAQDLCMERNLVRRCFATAHLQRFAGATETVEGIRALAIDKDHAPRWRPEKITDITQEMILGYFEPCWPEDYHPLSHLMDQ